MAKMVPELLPELIENKAERLVYTSCQQLPSAYTVFYSYKFYKQGNADELTREPDFVIVHPSLGYVVVEVKPGDIGFFNGQWQEFKQGSYVPLDKDPAQQAQTAMYRLRELYKTKTGGDFFPLKCRFALCFPECARISGERPSSLKPDSMWTLGDMDRLEDKLRSLFDQPPLEKEPEAVHTLISEVLAPKFKLYSSLEDNISSFRKIAERVLTEEQERILAETEGDKRKIFFGSAGTGKTHIAIEKARRSASQGKRVFLTCYNKHLVSVFNESVQTPLVTAKNFLDFLLEYLQGVGYDIDLPWNLDEYERFFNVELPLLAFDHFTGADDDEKFDVVLVDEGQDFKEEWLLCLEAMLRRDGVLYIFADPNQNLFGIDSGFLGKYAVSKNRLTVNLRNSDKINEWTRPFVSGKMTRSRLLNGMPVAALSWKDAAEEKRLLENEIGRLVTQGLSPSRITILSPNRKDRSCLGEVNRIKDWPITHFSGGQAGIKFATIRSFKGLEADVVFVIGVKAKSLICTPADIYVGASRARFMLYILHQEGWEMPQAKVDLLTM